MGAFFGFFGGQRSTESSVLRQYDEDLAHRWTSEKLITHIQVVFAFKLYNLSMLDTPVPRLYFSRATAAVHYLSKTHLGVFDPQKI